MGGVNLNVRQLNFRTRISLETALKNKGSETATDLGKRFQTRKALENTGRTLATLTRQVQLFDDSRRVAVELEEALQRRDQTNPFWNGELQMCIGPEIFETGSAVTNLMSSVDDELDSSALTVPRPPLERWILSQWEWWLGNSLERRTPIFRQLQALSREEVGEVVLAALQNPMALSALTVLVWAQNPSAELGLLLLAQTDSHQLIQNIQSGMTTSAHVRNIAIHSLRLLAAHGYEEAKTAIRKFESEEVSMHAEKARKLEPTSLSKILGLVWKNHRDALRVVMSIDLMALKQAAEDGMVMAVYALRARRFYGEDDDAFRVFSSIDRNLLKEKVEAGDHGAVEVLDVLVDNPGDDADTALREADPTFFIDSFLRKPNYRDARTLSHFIRPGNQKAIAAIQKFTAEQLGLVAEETDGDTSLFISFQDAGNAFAAVIAGQLLRQTIRVAEDHLFHGEQPRALVEGKQREEN